MVLCTVKDDTMFVGSLHQAQEVLIMLLRGMAKYAYIIMYGDDSR